MNSSRSSKTGDSRGFEGMRRPSEAELVLGQLAEAFFQSEAANPRLPGTPKSGSTRVKGLGESSFESPAPFELLDFSRERPLYRVASPALGFEVRDNGTGIPADALSKVLEPLFTTKLRATGLGLAIVVPVSEPSLAPAPELGGAADLRGPAGSRDD
jgi:hypothetical protein